MPNRRNAKEASSLFHWTIPAGKAIGHVLDVVAGSLGDTAQDDGSAGVVDAFAHVPYGRQLAAEEFLQGVTGFGSPFFTAEAEFQEREGSTAVGEQEDVVL